MNFSYSMPTKLSFGFGALETVGEKAGEDVEKAYHAAERMEAGAARINSPPIARAEVPCGGFKQIGFGRGLEIEGFHHQYETRSIHVLEYGKEKKWALST